MDRLWDAGAYPGSAYPDISRGDNDRDTELCLQSRHHRLCFGRGRDFGSCPCRCWDSSSRCFRVYLGARGASEAQQAASEATQQANETRAEAVADIADTEALAHVVDRIANTAIRGQPSPEGKRLLSEDDLNTLVDASRTARAKRTRRTAASE